MVNFQKIMKAIILAAGEGTRLRPLTYQMPKAMVTVGGKSLLEHNMDTLLPYVDEFIIVVKYKKESVINTIGNTYSGIPVRYQVQNDEKWTGAAIKWIQATGELVIVYADAIISTEDVDNIMKQPWFAVFWKKVPNPEKYGIFNISDGYIKEIIEKPQMYIWDLANFWFFKVNDDILKIIEDVQLSPRGEIEITDAINMFVKSNKMKCVELKNNIIDVTSLADLEKANKDYFPLPEFGETRCLESLWGLELHIGISKNHFWDIVKNSTNTNDTALQKNTSDMKRFSSKENLEKWYSDEARYTFTLVSKEWEIAGILWYRPSLPPIIVEGREKEKIKELFEKTEFAHTGGIRIYPNFRGKGLATPFLQQSEKHYKQIFPTGWICIDINEENIASQKSYEKAWYSFIWYGENQKTVQNETHQRRVYVKDFNENIWKK